MDAIREVNRRLLEGSALEAHGGRLRDRQNWVGGNRVNPVGAAYVPPRPELVPALMDDLAAFAEGSPLPACAVAAVAHAQLETVHPFADGNGRTGRALVHAVLRRRGVAPSVVPPVSLVLATDRDRYIANLVAYRTDEDDPSSPGLDDAASDWVEYFCSALVEACRRADGFERTLEGVLGAWRERVRPRSGSAADLLLGALVDEPVVSVATAARMVGRSREAARLGRGEARGGRRPGAELEKQEERDLRRARRRRRLHRLRAQPRLAVGGHLARRPGQARPAEATVAPLTRSPPGGPPSEPMRFPRPWDRYPGGFRPTETGS